MNSRELSILVMSCDKYSGIWNDFFNLKEKYWPDCPYTTYLATDSKEFRRKGVNVIHFGNIREWSKCVRETVMRIETPYVCLWLEDALIYETIDTDVWESDIKYIMENKVDYFCVEIKRRFKPDEMKQIAPHIRVIDPHQRYGVDTAVAIWEKNFFLDKLQKDCNAWQFEVDRCSEAATEEGIKGLTLYDDRHPANVSPIEVLRRGELRPQAIKFFASIGYNLNTEGLPVMNRWKVFKESLRQVASKSKYGKRFLKQIGRKLGFYVYTDKE